jgi:hypothetical protein
MPPLGPGAGGNRLFGLLEVQMVSGAVVTSLNLIFPFNLNVPSELKKI